MIYIDAREESRHMWQKELQHEGMEASVSPNLFTDFVWNCPSGLVGVERKTWTDFVSSITSSGSNDGQSRASRQLIEAPKSISIKVLFLEGALPGYIDLGKTMWPAEDMDNAVVSMQWQFGCIVVHSVSHDHTPRRLAALYRYTQKEDHMSLLRPMPPVPEQNVYFNADFRRKIAAFMTVPMLGEKGALSIAAETESPQQAINMTQDQLLKLPGMGKTRAANFVKHWQGKW